MRLHNDILGLRIEELGISTKLYRTLKHAGVDTIGDLMHAVEDEAFSTFVPELVAAMGRAKRRVIQLKGKS